MISNFEKAEGSSFLRIWVRGPQAKAVLTAILRQRSAPFHRDYPALSGSGDLYSTGNGWCAILAGRELRQAVREQMHWSATDLDRLRAVYHTGGMADCVRVFEGRTYQAIAGALKRHKISAGRRRAEVMTGRKYDRPR